MPAETLRELMQRLSEHPSWGAFWGFFAAACTAFAGRMMYLAEEARLGRRRFFTWALLLELPIALGMGLIGGGLAEWWGLEGMPAYALVAALAYLGPNGIESAFQAMLRNRR